MSLKRLLQQGRLRAHRTSKQEIVELLALVKRDIKDAHVKNLSVDRRFTTAYNAVLQLSTILLYCEGYRTEGKGHHATVFLAIREILGKAYHTLTDYFDSCRAKRNITDYEHAGEISEAEAEELIKEAGRFSETVIAWLKKYRPDYL